METNRTPAPPAAPPKPRAAQLAQASWVAPLLALGLIAATRQALGGASDAVRDLIVTFGGSALYSIGAACGVAALLGVGRHGRAGILVPALVGTVVSTGMLVVVATNFWSAYRRAADPQRILERAVAELRPELPRRIDDDTTLTAVAAEPKLLVYDFTLSNYRSDEIDRELFCTKMAPAFRQQVCEPMKSLWKIGLGVKARYSSSDSVVLCEIVVHGSDCGPG